MSQGVDNSRKALLHCKVVENWFKPIQNVNSFSAVCK